MTADPKGRGLFIVDNSVSGWTGLRYLEEWAGIAKAFDIATGYFKIGALLALDGQWQSLDNIRILMGAETTYRTRTALLDAVRAHAVQILDGSLEANKDTNPFLHGVPAILDALRSGQIECRVYDKNKFHAKAYITHTMLEVVGSQALVESSNFTAPGLTKNIELNIQVQSAREVAQLQEWFEAHWNEAVVVTDSIVETISRHTHRYTPFDVYAKALQEYFRGHELTATEWDETRSKMFSRIDRYQQEACRALMKIARQHGGAFLCDGVGLGKTFVGLMLIERLVLHEGKRVVLFAPKATKEGVWEPHLREWLPHIGGVGGNADFSNLAVFSHTDLGRKGDFPERFRRIAELADIVVIDEAHHFRTLVLTPVLDRALHTDSKNIHRFRQRQALAETAAFVDEHMASVRSFPDAFTLLTHSMQKTEGIDGPVCEFGVASGRSINHIAKLVPHETVFGFDSFDGLPEDWQGVMPKGTFRRKELPAVRDNVSLNPRTVCGYARQLSRRPCGASQAPSCGLRSLFFDENDFRAAGSSYPTGLGHRFRRVLQLRRQAAARIQSLRRSGAKDGEEFRVPGLLPIRLTSGGPDWSDGKLEDRLSMSVRGSRAG